jgi:hypothetical protein
MDIVMCAELGLLHYEKTQISDVGVRDSNEVQQNLS